MAEVLLYARYGIAAANAGGSGSAFGSPDELVVGLTVEAASVQEDFDHEFPLPASVVESTGWKAVRRARTPRCMLR